MDHKDLEAWKQAICLVEEVYKISATFPKQETYGLTSQTRRAAVSIPSNISEGAARNGRKEYSNFLGISLGSLAEFAGCGLGQAPAPRLCPSAPQGP